MFQRIFSRFGSVLHQTEVGSPCDFKCNRFKHFRRKLELDSPSSIRNSKDLLNINESTQELTEPITAMCSTLPLNLVVAT